MLIKKHSFLAKTKVAAVELLRFRSLLITKKKFLNIDGTLTTGSKYKLIEWNEYKIGFIYSGGENSYYQGLDRITGVLSYSADYNCEKIDKPKF